MFSRVPRRAPSEPRLLSGAANHGDEDDNISLTSTAAEEWDPSKEFTIKDIHLEIPGEELGYDDGELRFLVEWEDYPLHECTWEPASSIGDTSFWEEKKARQRRGEETAWTLEDYERMINTYEEEKLARHRRRNARRRELGLPLTEPLDDSDSSDDEAEESRPLAEIAAEKRRLQGQQSSQMPSNADRQSHRVHDLPSPGVSHRISNRAPIPIRQERPSATGYEGTARKVLPTNHDQTLTSRGILSASREPRVIKRVAKKTAQLPRPIKASSGGRLPKGRRGLNELMSDPTQEPRFFQNHRVRRLAEKFSRDKEDRPSPLDMAMFIDLRAPRRQSSGTEPSSATSEKKKQPQIGAAADALRTASSEAGSYPTTSLSPRSTLPAEGGEPKKRAPTPPVTQSPRDHAMRRSTNATNTASALSPIELTSSTVAPFAVLPNLPDQTAAAVSPWDAALPRKPKKRKSVRWEDADDSLFVDEPAPMEMEMDAPVTGNGATELPHPTPTPTIPTRVVQMRMKFGFVQHLPPVSAHLDGVPLAPTTDDPWLSDFLKTEVLQLEYTCSVGDFSAYQAAIWQHQLCAGTVGPSSPVLETVAAYLRDGSEALFQTTQTYCLLVFPADSEGWRALVTELGVPPQPETGVIGSLRYCVFRATDCYAPWLRGPIPANNLERDSNRDLEKLLWRYLRFDYQTLVPPSKTGATKDAAHHCFLLFPRSANMWLEIITRWLRLCSPQTHIYIGYDSGSWGAFCDAVGKPAYGIVIVHELLLGSLRRVPDLWNQVYHHRDSFWCLSEALHPEPIFPHSPLPDLVVPPADIQLIPLFPTRPKRRFAILLTPSFMSSEPQFAFKLLNHVWDFYSKRRSLTWILLTAFNLPEYLEELAKQRAGERERILRRNHDRDTGEREAESKGLSHENCEHWFKLSMLASEFHQLRQQALFQYESNEEYSPLQYAGRCIDPNDEQSLVNWFGWWTEARLDEFRSFFVVGSSSGTKLRGLISRWIRVPRYSSVTINDPDSIAEDVRLPNQRIEPSQAITETPVDEKTHQTPGATTQVKTKSLTSLSSRLGFQSQRVRADDKWAFNSVLQGIATKSKHLMLNIFAVSWIDSSMAVQFGDIAENFSSVSKWWKFPYPFSTKHPMNTYVGFFYTPVIDDWHPGAPAPTPLVRHPWICVYRAAEGNRAPPVGPCEILIWDPAAGERFSGGQKPTLQALPYCQRKTIEFIDDNTAAKNPGSYIEHVWYGGFKHPPNVDSRFPIDITLAQLDVMMANHYDHLPIKNSWKFEELGYREVLRKRPERSPASQTSEPMDIDTQSDAVENPSGHDEEDEDTRIIFHPPRGKLMPHGHRTKCTNHLYKTVDAAKNKAKRKGQPPPREILYEFPPTTEWYDNQRTEGRGFEHVFVGPWDSAFQLLKIPHGRQPVQTQEPRRSSSNAGQ